MKKTYEPGYGFSIKPEPGMDTLEPPKLPPMRLFVVRRDIGIENHVRTVGGAEVTIAAHLCTIVDGKLCFFEFRPVQDDLGGLGQFMHRAFSEWIDVEEIQIPGDGSKVVN